ncbi:solute carrier family 22 member 3-like [Ostrinia furnacalis]|uniref:solute carrier family 22 member 3-like n=1 Tax=Ostrinia furnacalis TaxID=93504 RepID=UPI001039ECDE|nr:solute carrier family 22 member 3-like [Ostrinia furnacalis]
MKIKAGISRYIVTQSKKETFEDDYVTKTMGAFGNYQSLVCSISVIARMISSCNIMSIVFLTSKTEFVCTRFKDGIRRLVQNSTCYDDCVQYKYNSLVFDETLISTFGLICDRAWLTSFTQTITMFGLAFGVAILGWCSDRFGRRIAFVLSASICVLFMIAAPFVSNYSLYNAFRFFAGFGSGGIMAINVVYNIEIVGSKYRETAGATGLIADGLAIMFLAVVAHYTSKWQTYLLILGLVSGMILILMLFIPETPRWLIAQRKKEQAIQLMTKIATFNRLETSHISETVSKVIEELETVEVKKQTYLDLFNNRKITKVTIVYAVIWTLGGICYYGITHYSTLLGLNIFVMVPLMGFLQIIGNIIAIPVNKYLGRKISVICNLLLVAAMMTILIFIPDGHWGCAVTSLPSSPSALFACSTFMSTSCIPLL